MNDILKDLEAKNTAAAAKVASTKRKSVPGGKENDPKSAKVDAKGVNLIYNNKWIRNIRFCRQKTGR